MLIGEMNVATVGIRAVKGAFMYSNDISPKVLYEEHGLSIREVAAVHGYSYAGMRERLMREGVILRKGGGSNKSDGQKLDDSLIASQYLQGLSADEIAAQLGCSQAGVKTSLRRSGISMRGHGGKRTAKAFGFEPTKEWMEQAMVAFGHCASDAAKHYGVKYATWIEALIRFDIPRQSPGTVLIGRPSHRRQEIPIEEAVQLSNAGTTYQELAERYSVSYGVICRRMKDVGHEAPWRRTKDPRFSTHSTKKRKVLQELGITACELCGEDRALDFAHIKPSAEGGLVEKENCLVLCPAHHRIYDTGQLTKAEFRVILPKVRAAEVLYDWRNKHYGGW